MAVRMCCRIAAVFSLASVCVACSPKDEDFQHTARYTTIRVSQDGALAPTGDLLGRRSSAVTLLVEPDVTVRRAGALLAEQLDVAGQVDMQLPDGTFIPPTVWVREVKPYKSPPDYGKRRLEVLVEVSGAATCRLRLGPFVFDSVKAFCREFPIVATTYHFKQIYDDQCVVFIMIDDAADTLTIGDVGHLLTAIRSAGFQDAQLYQEIRASPSPQADVIME